MEKDLLILGGGPGGLSTALHLAPRILILEKESLPRRRSQSPFSAANFHSTDTGSGLREAVWVKRFLRAGSSPTSSIPSSQVEVVSNPAVADHAPRCVARRMDIHFELE